MKLERGIDRDYIIDYNTGEIIFTSRNLITKDDRFYVEYEYNERNISICYHSSQKFINKSLDLSVHIYSESDWKNHNYLAELSDSENKFFQRQVIRKVIFIPYRLIALLILKKKYYIKK